MDYRNPPPGLFVYRTRIWFDELDALGVLHHSRFVYHLERAQKSMFAALMGVDTLDPVVAPDIYALVRDLELHYTAPIGGECEVLVALAVVRVRAAGLTVRFAFRSADGATLHCHGERTICRMSVETRGPAEWTPLFRERYGVWAADAEALPARL